jgi:hypothetical protein
VFIPVALATGATGAFIVGVVTVVLGWLPALWWGQLTDSLAMLNAMQGPSVMRFLAAPATVAAFRWGMPAACSAFALLTLTSAVWSLAYLIPLGIAVGIWLETPGKQVPSGQDRRTGEPRAR